MIRLSQDNASPAIQAKFRDCSSLQSAYAAGYTLVPKLKGAHGWGGVPAGIRLPPRLTGLPPHVRTCLERERGPWRSRSQFSGLQNSTWADLSGGLWRCRTPVLVAWLGLEGIHASILTDLPSNEDKGWGELPKHAYLPSYIAEHD